jgi:hypothetical protein
MLLRRIARAALRRLSLYWNELRRTSLFFKGLFMIRHINDYAVAAINGTLAPVAIPISSAPLESTTNR